MTVLGWTREQATEGAMALLPKVSLADKARPVRPRYPAASSSGRTAIIVTHELRFAREVASHVVFMENGVIVEEGPPDQVLGDPREARTRAFTGRIAA